MRKTSSITTIVKSLFLFKKPRFSELDFVDLIIDNNPIFLIAWKINFGYRLKIKPIQKSYGNSGALLIHIPTDINSIELIAANLWRTTKIKIELKHIELDTRTASSLIQTFKPVNTIEIKTFNLFIQNKAMVKYFNVHIQPNKMYLRKTFKLIREQFIYHKL